MIDYPKEQESYVCSALPANREQHSSGQGSLVHQTMACVKDAVNPAAHYRLARLFESVPHFLPPADELSDVV